MAKQQAVEAGSDEAVFVREGVVMEGASSAVFIQLDGELRTHPLTTHILPSISRELVMEIAAELNVPVREFPVLERDLPRATEMFIARYMAATSAIEIRIARGTLRAASFTSPPRNVML